MKEKLLVWFLFGVLSLWSASANDDSNVILYNRPMGDSYGYLTYYPASGFDNFVPGYPTREANPRSLIVNDTKVFVIGTFDLWNQVLVGGIVQYDIPTQTWSSLGMGMIGRIDSLLVDKHTLVFFGAITGYQENPSISAKGVVRCDDSGKNCEQYGNGISDYLEFGSIQLLDSLTYTSYQSTNRTWLVRKYNSDSKNWQIIFSANAFIQIATVDGTIHVVGNFSYGSSNGSIASYSALSSDWTVLSSQPVFEPTSRPSIATYSNQIWAFTHPQQLVRWNSVIATWQTIPLPFACDATSKIYGGHYLTMLCNSTSFLLVNATVYQSTWTVLDFGINEVTQLASASTGFIYGSGPIIPSGIFILQKLVNSTEFTTSYVLNISQTETTFRGQCAVWPKILVSGEFNTVYTTPVTNYTALFDGKEWKNMPVAPSDVLCCTNNNTLFVGFEKQQTNQMTFGLFDYDHDKFDLYHVNISYGNGSLSVIRATPHYLYFAYGSSSFASIMRWKLKGNLASDLEYLFNITDVTHSSIAVNDIQTDDSVLFIGGRFLINFTLDNTARTSLNFAKFNLESKNFEYVENVGTNQSTVLSISMTPNTVFVGGSFLTAGTLRVNNIAGCTWNGTFVDNLNSGVPTSSLAKDLIYDAKEDTLYFLASEKFSCGAACSTMYGYLVSEKFLDYDIKEGVSTIFLAVPTAISDDDSSDDGTLFFVLIIVLPSVFVILSIVLAVYVRKRLKKAGYLEISDGPLFGFSSSDYDSIDFAVEPFELKTLLGRGSFGSVWSCVLPNRNGATFAVKQMMLSVGDAERLNVIENEIATLQRLKHKNIVHFVGYKKVEGASTVEFFIFMELFEKPSSLKGVITKMAKKGETFPPKKVKDMLLQIAEGLKYLHNNGIAHRDLKSANVLVRVSGGEVRSLHIADFGLATTAAVATTLTGTPAFMAPEMSEKKYDPFKADIWAFGIVMYEILTLQEPAVAGIRPSLPDSVATDPRYDSAVTLFNLCTSLDIDERPDANELLSLCHRL